MFKIDRRKLLQGLQDAHGVEVVGVLQLVYE